jgi:ribose transport system substrate-binding protein
MVRGILARHPDANALILTTLRDTLGAAQALIDLNKVGEVSLIGLADSPETRDYVKNGVIAAALVRDPAAAGRKCVETLLELDRNRNASAFVDTGIGVLTARGMSRDGGYQP